PHDILYTGNREGGKEVCEKANRVKSGAGSPWGAVGIDIWMLGVKRKVRKNAAPSARRDRRSEYRRRVNLWAVGTSQKVIMLINFGYDAHTRRADTGLHSGAAGLCGREAGGRGGAGAEDSCREAGVE